MLDVKIIGQAITICCCEVQNTREEVSRQEKEEVEMGGKDQGNREGEYKRSKAVWQTRRGEKEEEGDGRGRGEEEDSREGK